MKEKISSEMKKAEWKVQMHEKKKDNEKKEKKMEEI